MKPDLSKFVLFDGGFGTMLQKYGMATGEKPDLMNIKSPEVVKRIHKEYVAAGADVITTNTFGANAYKLSESATTEEVVTAAVKLVKESGAKFTALDIGPIGLLLEPYGSLSVDDAYEMFKAQAVAGEKAGADVVIIETMSDLLEIKTAILAIKENTSLPIFATMTYAEDGRTFLGTDPVSATVTLCALGVDAVGVNCSLGPDKLSDIVDQILEYSTVPVIVQANAGLPKIENGETKYDVSPEAFCEAMAKFVDKGVSVVGGCCGTTPEYTKALRAMLDDKKAPTKRQTRRHVAISGARRTVCLDNSTAVIGERINPTGKKKMKEALRTENYSYIYDEAIAQQQHGADILDVNAGLPEIDEVQVLKTLVKEIQQISDLPIQIDSSDPVAVESAVRIYAGKPIINSVNGKKENLDAILPIVKKYGTAVVGLTLDENGIPETAEERLEIARKIVTEAQTYGIDKENIFIDCLVLTASTNQALVMQTLKAVSLVKKELGVKTVLGVSNVSFGLPERELVNTTFLAAAFAAGLDAPILNPLSDSYMHTVAAYKVLDGEDADAAKFISAISEQSPEINGQEDIKTIIINGLKSKIVNAVESELQTTAAYDVINQQFIPALDEVGRKFEKGEFFLPQLMASAEAVKAGFDIIKKCSAADIKHDKGTIVLATVKGDVHDIGKNIVKMLLENYGYDVIDLGKDVDPQIIVDAVLKNNVKVVGLSALMTTTVKNMAITIKALRDAGSDCKVIVGGAVLNNEYAAMVGADFYAKDAAETVKIASTIFAK